MIEKINKLKKERNAVILVHSYQIGEIHEIADFVGDSLGLSRIAAKTAADVIVFCGVYFMAETAKILSPQKTVLIPDKNAGCPMADMITVNQLKELKAAHPNAKVLCYVNTSAEIKAESDVCCTSANAIEVVNTVLKDEEEIIFIPDKYLANHTSQVTGRKFITWNGFCPSHMKILPEYVQTQKELHPQALVLVHPECSQAVIDISDEVLSTDGICKYVTKSDKKEFIIGTEIGIIHRLQKENPDKLFYPASDLAICPNMKLTTLEKVLSSLENMQHQVEVKEEVAERAYTSIQRMLG